MPRPASGCAAHGAGVGVQDSKKEKKKKKRKGAGMTVARTGFGSRLSRNGLVLVEPHGSGGASAGILVA